MELARTNYHMFDTVDLAGYDIILGMPWLQEVNPDIDWTTFQWKHRSQTGGSHVQIMSPYHAHEAIAEGNLVFWVIPEEVEAGELRLYTVDSFLESEKQLAAARDSDPNPSANTQSLPEYLREYEDVFSAEKADTQPDHAPHDHSIELEPGKAPPHKPIYGLTEVEREVLKTYIKDALAKGWIRPSTSPAGAPILFVPKKDGTLRLCVDYRGLNAITIKNRYPLPLISETLDRLAGAKYYTKLDLRNAYHRIRIKEGDEWKTAFRTRYGHFEYLVMPFGLANAPATFQAYINRAMSDLLDTCVVVYLDDIVIYSDTWEEHEKQVRKVMERLRTFGLYAKLSKCTFSTDTIEYLGFMVTPEGIRMEEDRIRTIREWPVPASVKDIQSFIGFANFYRNFIPHFSRIVKPLTTRTQGPEGRSKKKYRNQQAKGPSLVLSQEEKKSFEDLKEAFCREPLLRHFDPRLPTRIESDASGKALGAVLTQLFKDGQWHPIAYWSRQLKGAEVRYETHDTEMLAIFAAFKHW